MSSLPELRPMTVEEWIAFEEAHPEIRHELVDGQIYAMTGGTRKHNLLTGNIYAACRAAALAQGCQAFVGDVKCLTGQNGFYPDVMVTCATDGPQHPLYVERPCLLVEVLSPSTGRTDKREKFAEYLRIASLEAYLIAEPEIVRIEVHQRTDDEWTHQLAGPGERIVLTCPDVVLEVDELYIGVG